MNSATLLKPQHQVQETKSRKGKLIGKWLRVDNRLVLHWVVDDDVQ